MRLRLRTAAAIVLACVAILATAGSLFCSPRPLPAGTRADLVLIEKQERRLSLMSHGRVLRSYRVALGPNPVGHKLREGDGRTPEGRYVIDFRKPDSAYHRALHLSYPNAADRAAARRRNVSPGGMIMIHGLPNRYAAIGSAHVARDWTLGCIALTNEEIEEVWRVTPNGTTVEIRP
jgi:murein L,D-transpeptidase YafK